jgi:hypothetical protein
VSRAYAVQPGGTEPGVARIRILSAEPEVLKRITGEGARREGFESRVAFLGYGRGLYVAVEGSPESTSKRAATGQMGARTISAGP